MLKALCISKSINKTAIELLESNNICIDIWDKINSPTEEELTNLINEYDILIIGVREKITNKMIRSLKHKVIIGSLSIGLDHIDKAYLSSNMIEVVNCPHSNVVSVAEHILTLILDASKRIQESNDLVLEGKGNRKFLSKKPSDISGKTIGLIGAGNITRKVVDFANFFNMKILCYTAHPNNHADLIQKGVTFVDLNSLLKLSDIINVSVPLNDNTKNLISEEKVKLMKKDAIFVNTSRTEVADVTALITYAEENKNFYLGLDIDVNHYSDLFSKKRNNVIVTPHIAGCTKEATDRTFIECAQNIINCINKINKDNNGISYVKKRN